MIGVAVPEHERPLAQEFFELFKTTWEFARTDGSYDVLLCSGQDMPSIAARLILCYSARPMPGDREAGILPDREMKQAVLCHGAMRLPIYGACVAWRGGRHRSVVAEQENAPVIVAVETGSSILVRAGFDLFKEVRFLLQNGQPAANAHFAALDHHIELMRELITRAGICLVEIPPVPTGHPFAVCLTHDVDHPAIRKHSWDHTMAGFIYRAVIGSVGRALRGRLRWGNVLRNWAAAGILPFVHLGWARDFWRDSLVAYGEMERGLGSTFFVIPFKGVSGRDGTGGAPPRRASKYDVTDVDSELSELMSRGAEIGLHGIDAWRDAADGRRERDQIARRTGAADMGIRMHWLYFDGHAPAALEQAGFAYDSSMGYNQAVGFRAGTAQVYSPLGTTSLMELPLHIMDTALFYPDYLDLDPVSARSVVRNIFDHVSRCGGVVTLNWHDRSIGTERCWKDFYLWMLEELKRRGAWFPTAAQAVAWFRKRRAASIESVSFDGRCFRIRASMNRQTAGPGLRLRVHRAAPAFDALIPAGGNFVDVPLEDGEISIAV
jgi:hypothetical protein